jgi:hypothetical protein
MNDIDPRALGMMACGSGALLLMLFMITVIICNRLGHKWARALYPNILLPDWRSKNDHD